MEHKFKVDDATDREALFVELEDILLKQEKENEDIIQLSQSLKTFLKIDTDLKPLGVLDQSYSDKIRDGFNDEQFLHRERCVAESRLIKTRILYKLNEEI